jgi:hypothetical protein
VENKSRSSLPLKWKKGHFRIRIRILCMGAKWEWRSGLRSGVWGIRKVRNLTIGPIQGGDIKCSGWVLTHIPTGLSVGECAFRSLAGVKALAESLSQYKQVTHPALKENKMPKFDQHTIDLGRWLAAQVKIRHAHDARQAVQT